MTDENSGMFDQYLYDGIGYIAWRRGTGDNVEITWLRSDQKRAGTGRRLLQAMLRRLRDENPPYCSVYGFTRSSNVDAIAFYRAMGFTLSPVKGVYADGEALVFSARFRDLVRQHLTESISTHTQAARNGQGD